MTLLFIISINVYDISLILL